MFALHTADSLFPGTKYGPEHHKEEPLDTKPGVSTKNHWSWPKTLPNHKNLFTIKGSVCGCNRLTKVVPFKVIWSSKT